MDIYPDFHGPHADGPHPHAEAIAWQTPAPRFPRVRIIKHTCQCQERFYELCAASGLAWIRVTIRTEWGPAILESRPSTYGAANDLWTKILTGQAT
ncbi:hypothetical protein [Nonomuraea sp. NPDC049480]|uniref:hypothetical protein n=1 Tax=Nonomuraea sp. NPDC049480 TaxID=3364353 RepID=UPI0037A3D9E5